MTVTAISCDLRCVFGLEGNKLSCIKRMKSVSERTRLVVVLCVCLTAGEKVCDSLFEIGVHVSVENFLIELVVLDCFEGFINQCNKN